MTVLFPVGPQPSVGNESNPHGTARDILDQRYARGELSRAQYDEMRQTIGQ
ncbi:MAG: SHOCT domain-containing protein [Anaerolineae bacterium]|nr:SHOCT domain-containing protein [Anaerolineae bacterium]